MTDQAIDVFYDMDIAQICQHFSKSRNTVDKAVAKLVKDYPDKHWKYKNPETRRITIKAEGVEKLSTYFRKEKHEISTVEMELRFENEKLQAILSEKEKTIAALEHLYTEKLRLEIEKSQQTFLLEQKNKDEQIAELTSENQKLKDAQALEIQKKESEINLLNVKKSELENQNTKLQEDLKLGTEKTDQVQQEMEKLRLKAEEYKRKEEEYNSKSFFYRLTHKFSLS